MLAGCAGDTCAQSNSSQICKPLPKLTNGERVIASVLHLTTCRIQTQDSLQVPVLRSRRRGGVPGDSGYRQGFRSREIGFLLTQYNGLLECTVTRNCMTPLVKKRGRNETLRNKVSPMILFLFFGRGRRNFPTPSTDAYKKSFFGSDRSLPNNWHIN